MEDSYTVHRRRKAAARKREKTPEPPRRRHEDDVEETDEEEERRARMERMVHETEMLEVIGANVKKVAESGKSGDETAEKVSSSLRDERAQRALKRAVSPEVRSCEEEKIREKVEKVDAKLCNEVPRRNESDDKLEKETRGLIVEVRKTSGSAETPSEVEDLHGRDDATLRKARKDAIGSSTKRRRDPAKDSSPEVALKSTSDGRKVEPKEATRRGNENRDIASDYNEPGKTSTQRSDEEPPTERATILDENRREAAREDDRETAPRSPSGKNLKNNDKQLRENDHVETDIKSSSRGNRETENVRSSMKIAEEKGRKSRDVKSPTKIRNSESRGSSSKRSSKETRSGYTTDSSENENLERPPLRRKKSPDVAGKSRLTGSKKTASRSRPTTDTDGDPDEREQRKRSEKRALSNHRRRASTETDEDTKDRGSSNHDFPRPPPRQTDKTRYNDRAKAFSDSNDPTFSTITKSDTFPPDNISRDRSAKPLGRSSTTEIKKQIIPLSDDSLIEDFERAQLDYLRKERSIFDHDPLDDYVDPRIETALRRRKLSIVRAEEEATQVPGQSEKKSWLAWLPFFGKRAKKEKIDETELERDTDTSKIKKYRQDETRIVQDETQIRKRISFLHFFRTLADFASEFRAFAEQNSRETRKIRILRNRCLVELLVAMIYCGLGAFVFRFTEGAFETFYKCGVKRVKRDFLDSLWNFSHNLREEDWKSMARRKLMEFEEQLHTAHEAGVHSYSGQKSWSFLNAVLYCLTVITTIGYGHISPSTTTGRAITIVYAIFGIPMFLIILADFGKLFTRGIKFLWAFVRRVYYTGSCRRVRRTVPVQEVMKGVQLVYDLATFRRPSQMNPEDIEEMEKQQNQTQTVLNLDGNAPPSAQPDTPGTPALSTFAIDDEFNLPISVAIVILLAYIFVGATVYNFWEQWGFFESFYFVFISMSTIGFGDYVPKHPIYMMLSIVYLVFGLALTSMCINVVQVMLSDSFRQASQKIGATIGFEVTEEDGSVHPAAPPPVEVADVHTTIKESESEEQVAPRAKQEDLEL